MTERDVAKPRETPSARNPFMSNRAHDTVHNVYCGLDLFSRLSQKGVVSTDDLAFGQFLTLQSMAEALAVAKTQLANERERSNAQTSSSDERGDGP